MFALLNIAFLLYEVILFARVIISWVPHNQSHPIIRWIYRLTEPLLAPIRSLLPTHRLGVDLSPLILLLAMSLLQRLLLKLNFSF